ncbi:putative holin [Bacillus phage vB_BhaS-171]|uniref:holin n=1 Tax=Bacillus phage vB_BhaS-171 TaxID=1775140 RepID=UPI000744D188|nr:holin [Bacillus phage vB_BhaS-171]ALY08084.1 putative holin [Bacillus phage vB_BhaS-171]
MEEVLILSTVISPIVLGVIQLIKNTVVFPKNFIPLMALIVGLGIGAISFPFTELDFTLRLWAGAFSGLAATGLFELGNKRDGHTKEEV